MANWISPSFKVGAIAALAYWLLAGFWLERPLTNAAYWPGLWGLGLPAAAVAGFVATAWALSRTESTEE